jgi:hypothetical protein
MVVYDVGMVRRLNDGRDGAGAFAQLELRTSDREWMLAQAAGLRRKRRGPESAGWVSAVLAYFSRR